MKKFKTKLSMFLFAIFAMTLFLTNISLAATPYSYKITLEEDIHFIHNTIINYDGHGGNQEVNYIEFDLNNENISLALIKANNLTASKETLLTQLNNSEYITGKNIIGGVNGEFFQMSNGQPLFTTISEGEIFSIISDPSDSKRPLFYIDKSGKYGFDFFTVSGAIKFIKGSYKDLQIESINKLDSYKHTNISNYKINEESTYYPHEGLPSRYMLIELFNSDGSIFAGTTIYGKVIDIGEMNEPKKIEKNQVLITSYGDENYYNIDYKFLNEIVSFNFNIYSKNEQKFKNDILHAFTGHEYLISSGKEMGIDYYKTLGDTSFITGRHARTALGITSYNKVILFTVDKSDDSLGMTLSELSKYLKDLDIVDAINLDGGGSTSIALENNTYTLKLMNDQTKYQREITNGIGIIVNKA
ncbi:Exopolysaccharide biosynthesis protein [Candidatus Arthromitus sp. SFB-mouse-SU]|nr:Exopolysaccharide biosynthesis protein [Candidatus Arthromitus sp. SFB-2]EIA23387.1 Exopolysaccharide biosynthesis protein [Candidatus Arthromitus sp. SFB-1]EIA27262.1 Exopolysaccharide biosynthesis protein [Candidatus Arthromitus sp. SFB-co]EIA30017.1 Exopolysaccharide biosynthesis protein [Candidatus Arthromitus sp. SFB-mouse-SU]